ncbi:MAG: hypothetical protein JNL25_09405, partial [Rhodospirillaceae bacterium]|nr:hypothetical protein [Rhodospirillaceae bacterium]
MGRPAIPSWAGLISKVMHIVPRVKPLCSAYSGGRCHRPGDRMPIAKTAALSPGRQLARRLIGRLRSDPLRLVAAAAIALTLLVMAMSVWWLYTLTRANTERELTNVSLIISEHMSRSLQTVDLILKQTQDRLKTQDLAESQDRLRMHLVLNDIARSLSFVRTIAIFDANGQELVISREYPSPNYNISGREYFQKLKSGQVSSTYVGMPSGSDATDERAITVSQTIANPDGTFSGIIRIGLETSYYEEFFAAIDLGEGTAVTLIRNDGILLLRSPPQPGVTGSDLSQTPVFTSVLADRDFGLTWHKSPVDHLWRFVAARRLAEAPMVVILSITGETALASWRQQVVVIVLGGIITIIFLLALTKIAARQLQHRERRTRQALEAANEASRAKSSFLGVMSHELRTPLNAIIGFSDVIARETFGPLSNPKYLDYVSDINQSGQNLLTLINQILDLSRIEAGKQDLAIEALHLTDVWQPIANAMAAAAASKGIRLEAPDTRSDLVFAGDRRAMMQILSNLVSNAIKFTPVDGAI